MASSSPLPDRLLTFARGFARGAGEGRVETLAGDASTRRYHRLTFAVGVPERMVVMELPADAHRAEEVTGGPPPQELPFLNVQRYLRGLGVAVPEVYGVDLSQGFIALEDLGDQTFEREVLAADGPAARMALYEEAVRALAQLQVQATARPDPGCVAFGRGFDKALLRWELDHFREWYLEAYEGVRLTGAEAAVLDEAFAWLADTLAASPRVFVHRDYQSRNLMVERTPEGARRLRLIDFQDALMGPAAYDLVALLRDSYVELTAAEVSALMDRFINDAGVADRDAFRRLFFQQTLQRKLKDTGRFVFIDRVRQNPSFLRWIPSSLRYIRDALPQVPQMAALGEVLRRHVPALR